MNDLILLNSSLAKVQQEIRYIEIWIVLPPGETLPYLAIIATHHHYLSEIKQMNSICYPAENK